jgi:hypothetical protein
MKKWRSLAQDGHPPVGTVCAYGVNDCDSNQNTYTVWAKGDQVEILAYRDRMAVIYNHTREAADIRNLDYDDEGPLVAALEEVAIDAPDWDNAPEDATHWEPENHEYVESWMKKDGAVWFYFVPKDKAWRKTSDVENWRIKRMIPRPQVEPKEWNGEGLPPTGTVCEMLHPGISEYGWQRVEIKAYFDDRVVVSGSPAIWGGGFGAIHINSKLKFRPIRSEEDQAVEEIAKILQNDHQIVTDTHSKNLDYFIGPARALYRSGYSKKEKK